MSTCSMELNQFVIKHTLKTLGICSRAVENLLIGTVATQNELSHQSETSYGIGVYGIDEATHCSIWDDYLAHDPDLASAVRGLASQHEFLKNPHIELATNLAYATAIAWMIYKRSGITLPHPEDINGLGVCWEEHFVKKTDAKRTKQTFIDAYMKLQHHNPGLAA